MFVAVGEEEEVAQLAGGPGGAEARVDRRAKHTKRGGHGVGPGGLDRSVFAPLAQSGQLMLPLL